MCIRVVHPYLLHTSLISTFGLDPRIRVIEIDRPLNLMKILLFIIMSNFTAGDLVVCI